MSILLKNWLQIEGKEVYTVTCFGPMTTRCPLDREFCRRDAAPIQITVDGNQKCLKIWSASIGWVALFLGILLPKIDLNWQVRKCPKLIHFSSSLPINSNTPKPTMHEIAEGIGVSSRHVRRCKKEVNLLRHQLTKHSLQPGTDPISAVTAESAGTRSAGDCATLSKANRYLLYRKPSYQAPRRVDTSELARNRGIDGH